MAEKTGELKHADNLDPLATTAGAGSDPFVEKYSKDLPGSEADRREMATNTGPAPEETEHLKAQIEETRKEMGETIDAIQERLSFSNLSEQVSEHVGNAIETAKETAYDATIGKAVNFMKNIGDGISDNTVTRTARNNPFPMMLIGLGAGLLAYNSYYGDRSARYRRSNFRTGYPEVGSGDSLTDKAQNKLGEVKGSVQYAAGTAYEGVSNKLSETYSEVNDLGHRAYEKVGEFGHLAYEKAGELGTRAHETYDYYIEENPLAVGAVALAVGAAIGFAIPSTRYEGELMGEARSNLLQKAQETATDLAERAKQAAGETSRTIKEDVRSI